MACAAVLTTLLALALSGCGVGGTAAPVVVDDPVFSKDVAARVLSAHLDAYRAGRWQQAALFWARGIRTACGGDAKAADALRAAARSAPGWPGFRVDSVLGVHTNPYPAAVFRIVRDGGENDRLELAFLREQGRWVIADPIPALAFSICTAPAR